MERGSITKWLLLALAAFLFFQVGWPRIFGSSSSGQGESAVVMDSGAPPERAAEEICTIDAGREGGFRAELSSKGASLKHLRLLGDHYALTEESDKDHAGNKIHEGNKGDPIDLVTTTREERMPLRTDLRAPGSPDAEQQAPFHDLDWKLEPQTDKKSCAFTYKNDTTALTKTIAWAGPDKPYALEVTVRVDNLSDAPKKHRFAIEQTSYRTKSEMEGHLGRQSEFLTETTAGLPGKTERQTAGDFESKAYEKDGPKPPNEKQFSSERWRSFPGAPNFVAVSSSYFSKILIPLSADLTPRAETKIEEYWRDPPYTYQTRDKDEYHGFIYRARLAYPEVELPAKGSVTYKTLAFAGPKERKVLASLNHGASEVLDLGTFAPIAQKLVWYVLKLRDLTGSWGFAIVLLTITLRILVAPLSLSQIKSSMAMRRLKPEMDVINAKYKDDATQRGIATQELWRKNGVTNPVLGCLPMLLQMPIWWALYRSLQTAVELYHEKFLWFADLSAPDKFYIIPVVLGASSFLQQRIMPPQGDAQQQKMMMYMMPAVFTFMMLFLPAGLGVYMLTNTWLGIGQQLLMERYYRSKGVGTSAIQVREKTLGEGGKPTPALGKGKARARG